MTGKEFLGQCNACGGNWTAMILSGIKKCFPEDYEKLTEGVIRFDDCIKVLEKHGLLKRQG